MTRRIDSKHRANVGNNNGQLHIATPPRVAHAKPPGPISMSQLSHSPQSQVNVLGPVITKLSLSLETSDVTLVWDD